MKQPLCGSSLHGDFKGLITQTANRKAIPLTVAAPAYEADIEAHDTEPGIARIEFGRTPPGTVVENSVEDTI